MALTVDLTPQFALLGRLISEILDKPAFKISTGAEADGSYTAQVPDAEPQRTEFLMKLAEDTFQTINARLIQPTKHTALLIKREILVLLTAIVRDSPSRYRDSLLLENPLVPKWRPMLQGLAFDCFRIMVQLSAKSLVRCAQDVITAAVRILQSRDDRKLNGLKEEYARLSEQIFDFMTTAIASPLISDLLPAATVRDLSECLLHDICKLGSSGVSPSAATCLILVLQTRSADLKADVKDRIFSALATSARSIVRIRQDRHLQLSERKCLHRLLEALTVFVLSTAVHVGVLNAVVAVFRDGLTVGDTEITITCRIGLQVVSSIVRPRVPLDVLDASLQLTEPATGRGRSVLINSGFPDQEPSRTPAESSKPSVITPLSDSAAALSLNSKHREKPATSITKRTAGAAGVESNLESPIPVGHSAILSEPMDSEEIGGTFKQPFGKSDSENAHQHKRSKVQPDTDIMEEVSAEAADLIASFEDIGTDDNLTGS